MKTPDINWKKTPDINWKWYCFADLTASRMHEILSARQEVFIVEQKCIYRDADSLDRSSLHLLGKAEAGRLAAYARLNRPGSRYSQPSIGRLLTLAPFRGTGLGAAAFRLAMEKSCKEYPGQGIRISAQLHLQGFYEAFDFHVYGLPYDEDGIAHIDMIREPDK